MQLPSPVDELGEPGAGAPEGSAAEGGSDPRPPGATTLRAGAVVAAALGAAFVTWLLVRGDEDTKSTIVTTVVTVPAVSTGVTSQPATTVPATPQPGATTKPKAVTEAELAALAVGRTVYWAEPPPRGRTMTFSEDRNGATFVRYLPEGVSTTDEIPPSLVIASYPMKGALAAVKRSSKAGGTVTTPLDGGGLAVHATARPTNVYFSFPNSPVQVEVYDPTPGKALELVRAGIVTPVAAP